MTGLTLPGMIDEPGCRSGMCDFAEAGVGAGAHPAQVVVDLRERDRRWCAAAPDASTSPSRLAWASKWSRASVIGSSVSCGEQLDDPLREAGRGVDAGADGGAAERDLGDAGERRLDALDAVADLARRSRRTPGRG